MPPKVSITKEEIIHKAVEIVREKGPDAINARDIAKALNCSTQPVFSNFETMRELRLAVMAAADTLYQTYTKQEVESGRYPTYKATGMAYIRFAKEEKELFKLLFMRDRSEDYGQTKSEDIRQIFTIVQDSTGIKGSKVRLFHMEMWAYVHGIAAMMATNYLELDTELVSEMLTDAYQGLRKRYEEKE